MKKLTTNVSYIYIGSSKSNSDHNIKSQISVPPKNMNIQSGNDVVSFIITLTFVKLL